MHLVRDRAYEFGVRGINSDALSLDLAAVVARKDDIVQGIVAGIYGWVTPNQISPLSVARLNLPHQLISGLMANASPLTRASLPQAHEPQISRLMG